MVTKPHPESRPRIAVGSLLFVLGVLGLVHLVSGRPDDPTLWNRGGGAIGYLAATPLATGLTVWVAVPVLVLLAAFAFLVLTGTPVRQVPGRVRRLLGKEVPAEEPTADPAVDAGLDPAGAEKVENLRRPSRRRQAARVADVYREGGEPENADVPPQVVPGEVVPPRPRKPAAAIVATPPPVDEQPDVAVGEQLRLHPQCDPRRAGVQAPAQRPAAHRPGAEDGAAAPTRP